MIIIQILNYCFLQTHLENTKRQQIIFISYVYQSWTTLPIIIRLTSTLENTRMDIGNPNNREISYMDYQQCQSTTLSNGHHKQISEYQLFKLRLANKDNITDQRSRISGRITIAIVLGMIAIVYMYSYLSQEVQFTQQFQPTSSQRQHFQDIFEQSPKKVEIPVNLPIAKLGSRLSDSYLPSGISDVQIAFASELRALPEFDYPQQSDIAAKQKAYYAQKYKIDEYAELPFCIVVPTYNNAVKSRHIKNIKTIVMQDYHNYHIVVIDDASTDGTGVEIFNFLEKESNIERERYQVIINKQRMLAMHNLRRAALQFCQPEEIFLVVDGDDQLLGRQVLKVFNAIFQSRSAWFVYSNFMTLNSRCGYSRPIPQYILTGNRYRYYPFVTSHLRAFYTHLFQNIREEDLKDEKGEYFKAANDVAICIPVIEQSGSKIFYLEQLTYVYNSNTGLNNHQVRQGQQLQNKAKIRRKKRYQPLQRLP